MPRQLLSSETWRPLKIKREEAKCGDLLFVSNKRNEKLLSHIALVLGVNQIFHCTLSLGRAVVQSDEEFFSHYGQRLKFRKMVRYIDSRNEKLRKDHKGIFITD